MKATPPASCITTDLTISGKAAQFGRGVLSDVASNLIGQFAKNLEADMLGGSRRQPDHTRRRPPSHRRLRPTPATPSICSKSLRCRWPSGPRPVIAAVAAGVAIGFLLGQAQAPTYPRRQLTDDLQAALARLLSSMSQAERLRP